MTGYTFPVTGKYNITSKFGQRKKPTKGATTNHQGIDIAVPVGTPVLSAFTGTIKRRGYDKSRGNWIEVDNGNGLTAIYQHLSNFKANIGATVSEGQKIALSGNTGTSTGAHLHFELQKNGIAVNPLTYGGQGSVSGALSSIQSSGILGTIKDNWLYVAGAILIIAIVTK